LFPLNTLRTVLVLLMFVIISVALFVPSIASYFGINITIKEIGVTNLLFLLVVILTMVPIIRFFSNIVDRIKDNKKKEEIEENIDL